MQPVHYSQAVEVNAGTMTTASGQYLTTSIGNFPQQMISGAGKPTILVKQPGYIPVNGNQQAGAFTVTGQKENSTTSQNQFTALHPNSFYVSTLPAHSSSQVFNGSHIREVSSQPQIITAQTPGHMLNQPQLLCSILNPSQSGFQTANTLQPGLSWASSNQQHCQNPVIFYNPQTGMQTALQLPLVAATQPVTSTSVASAYVPPRLKNIYCKEKVKNLIGPPESISTRFFASSPPITSIHGLVNQTLPSTIAQQFMGAYQTDSNKVQIVNDGTIFTGIKTEPVPLQTKILLKKSKTTTVPFTRVHQVRSILPNIPITTVPTHISQTLPSTETQQKFITVQQTDSNQMQIVNGGTKSNEVETNPVSPETKNCFPQKSQTILVPYSENSQACVAPTIDISAVSTAPISSIIESTGVSVPTASTQLATVDAHVNEMSSSPVPLQKFSAIYQTSLHPKQLVNDEKMSEFVGKPMSIENKISSPQKSQPKVNVLSSIPITSTKNVSLDVASADTFTLNVPRISSVDIITSSIPTVSSVDTITLSGPTVSSVDTITSRIPTVSSVDTITLSGPTVSSVDTITSSIPTVSSVDTITSSIPTVSFVDTITLTGPTVSSVDTITSSIPTVSSVDTVVSIMSSMPSVSPDFSWTDRVSYDLNSKITFPEAHNKGVYTSYLTNSTESVITTENLKSQQAIQQITSNLVKSRKKAIVRPQVLTHVINGFIIQESSEPFPVSPSALLDSPCKVLSPDTLISSKGMEVTSTEKETRALRPRGIVELAICAHCGLSGSHFRIKKKKRFCSKFCAKQFSKLNSNHAQITTSSFHGHEGSGVHSRKRKRKRGRKRILIESLEGKENINFVNVGENSSTHVSELSASAKTGENNSRLETKSTVSCETRVDISAPEEESMTSYQTGIDDSVPENEPTMPCITREVYSVPKSELIISCQTDGDNSVPETESALSCITMKDYSEPASSSNDQTPVEVDKSNDELGRSKSDLLQTLPSKWTVQDVFEFIQNFPGCSDYADNFKSHEVDGQVLFLLNHDHLTTSLSMKLGPALKLLSHIRNMKEILKS